MKNSKEIFLQILEFFISCNFVINSKEIWLKKRLHLNNSNNLIVHMRNSITTNTDNLIWVYERKYYKK